MSNSFNTCSLSFIRTLLITLIVLFCFSCSTKPQRGSLRYPVIKQGTKYYRVTKGDTLFSISWRAKLDYHAVARWNGISPPYTIHIGQIIRLSNQNQLVKRKKEVTFNRKKTSQKNKAKRKPTRIVKKSKKLLKIHWQWPLKGVITRTFSQTGQRGLDIAGKRGQGVLAAAGGKVVYSGSGLLGYGNLIIIKHTEKFLSAYGNNRKLLTKEGELVRRGQKIAELGGKMGKQPALHFEIRVYGIPVNPLNYLPKG